MRTILLALVLIGSSAFAAEDHIDINGFHLGMRNKAFLDHLLEFSSHSWQHKPKLMLGDVPLSAPFNNHGCKNQAGCSLFLTGTVDWFSFRFDAASFEAVKAAIVARYPETACDANKCVYQTSSETLTVTPGELSLISNAT
jgi:hypothetical protein